VRNITNRNLLQILRRSCVFLLDRIGQQKEKPPFFSGFLIWLDLIGLKMVAGRGFEPLTPSELAEGAENNPALNKQVCYASSSRVLSPFGQKTHAAF